MYKRVEFSQGTSHKFWEVEVVGSEVTTRWRKIGTAGQSRSKSYSDDAADLTAVAASLDEYLVRRA